MLDHSEISMVMEGIGFTNEVGSCLALREVGLM